MAEVAKKTIELDLISRLDDFKKSISQVPGITEKEARKAARLMERAFKDATGGVKKAAQTDIGGGLKSAAEAAGGPIGETAAKIGHLGAAFKALASPAGVAVGALVGGTLALGAFTGASVAAVLAADDLATELEGLNALPAFEPLPPGVVSQIESANNAVGALRAIAQQAVVTFGAEMAPAVEHASTLLVKMGLMALDAFESFAQGKSLARELAVFLVDELVDAFGGPIDGATRLAGVFGELAGALGQDEIAAKLQGVRDAWEGFSRGVAETAVDSWIGVAADGVAALDAATADYDARARELIGTVGDLADAEAGRAAGEKAAAEEAKRLQEAAAATRELEAVTAKATNSQLDGYARVNAELGEQLARIDELLAKGGDLAAVEAARAAVAAQANQQTSELLANLATEMAAAKTELEGVVAELEAMEAAAKAEIGEALKGALTEVASSITAVIGEALNQQLDAASDTQAALQGLGEEASAAERQALLEQLEAQKEQALKLFRAQKTGAISSALINGALAVTTALAQLGPIAGAIAAGAIGATTAAQVGIIAAQPPPEFHQGGVVGDPSEVPAVLRRGEGVLTSQGVASVGGPEAVHAANRGAAPATRTTLELRVGARTTERQVLLAVGASGQLRETLTALQSSGRRNPYGGRRG